MNRALEVDALSVTLGGRRILDRVSLTVESGELVGLIGPNGAGKTTLMRAIMGLLSIEGRIRTMDGPIGYVPQRQDLDWSYPMSAAQLVAGAYVGMRRAPRRLERLEAVYRALDAVGMYDYRNRTIQETSGGQKQRLLVARALVTGPKLLLLDEPFTGLDHPNQDALSRLFVDLARTGVGVLMSTHDLTQAVDICHRIVMLNRSVKADGEPDALLEPGLWMDTFDVAEDSALLRSLGMVKR
ncbi:MULTISPECIES: metal ABC transporter ATP-binding protein [Schaalia]|uniref:metal ABC transporter ATP-binding protein n=1 Tax=Schaalia TaxID=2529408 RepID=UPI002A827BB7|nr:metal ABC transporter ATP-binding protein [Schaalia hyovaginalis]MDY4491820.1 metal ABC transporter ATP-binding protein [Schaalia hyovaginalis]